MTLRHDCRYKPIFLPPPPVFLPALEPGLFIWVVPCNYWPTLSGIQHQWFMNSFATHYWIMVRTAQPAIHWDNLMWLVILTDCPLGDLTVILKVQFQTHYKNSGIRIPCENDLQWMPQNLTNEKSTLLWETLHEPMLAKIYIAIVFWSVF